MFGLREDHPGAGRPRGLVLEIWAVLIVVLFLGSTLFVLQFNQYQEKQVYLRSSLERINTAAGTP